MRVTRPQMHILDKDLLWFISGSCSSEHFTRASYQRERKVHMMASPQLTLPIHELLDSITASSKYVEAIEAQIEGRTLRPLASEMILTDLLEGTAKQLARANQSLGRIYKAYMAAIVDPASQDTSGCSVGARSERNCR
jgi:hypothetical protein